MLHEQPADAKVRATRHDAIGRCGQDFHQAASSMCRAACECAAHVLEAGRVDETALPSTRARSTVVREIDDIAS